MTVYGLDDLSTIEALATQLGVSAEKAQRIVEAAGVRIVEGCFSVSRLHTAMAGSVTAPGDTAPLVGSRVTHDDQLRGALERLLGRHRVVIVDSIRRRTLEVTIATAPSSAPVFYSPFARPPVHETSDDEDTLAGSYSGEPDDPEDYEEISSANPRTARVFYSAKERNGTSDFTIGGVTSPSADYAIFLGPRLDRAWMIPTSDLRSAYRVLQHRKANPSWDGNPPKGMHLHSKPNALRVLLSRSPSVYELHRRLTEGGDQ